MTMLGNRPRVKKSTFVPPPKKRKATHSLEEIKFDFDARSEYLTGFHKRKLQRVKNAQEEAAKRARQEKIELRKQLRDDRKREVEEHVSSVKTILREAERAGNLDAEDGTDSEDAGDDEGEGKEAWGGFEDPVTTTTDIIDQEDEYIDEDRYTTVTVESVTVSKDGLNKPAPEEDSDEEKAKRIQEAARTNETKGKARPPKKKKPKFRYETKIERQISRRKQSAKKRGKAEK
ncbi:nucleolar protein 12-domain-containing protein [Microdochium trichocladiopsis]|uniref:Nucleolar protein 12-domain-containing protein n=1 Tax=Microdochium trichocladiopsis TaxID=1682393 RepID=A0A9P8Y701_9PEZI|nr:nucleolar protein 12-domain-containing protein [Microdochium trichocladiopsis]KAH7033315.1 nucleolar protein 12-domain-containing protein [Microdochium trichocladiopsis]